jgi:acyl-lipid omega-6 desaturase (Delta-12 desaturase)
MTATTPRPTLGDQPLPSHPPSTVKPQLKDVIKSLPPECFQKNRRKAWSAVAISVVAVMVGYVAIAFSPWYLLPFAWFYTGTALTGFFVIGHDCGHRSFAKRRWVNDWVGHIMMLPLIYPFHSWRLLHDHHHLHTNKQGVDNAWHPWYVEDYNAENSVVKAFYQALRGKLWWMASIAHWIGIHFDLNNYASRDRKKAAFSNALVIGFAALLFPTLIATLGVWGLVKFWLLPWLGYHFWMSTFTLVHHTAPDIQFRPGETWDAFESQLAGTVHCDYPAWVERLCHDINVHVPHHISVAIPSYNLRLAHQSIKQTWGSKVIERKFNWQLMKTIVEHCHLYHPEKAYLPFKAVR